MLNQIVLIGKLTENPKLNTSENGVKVTSISVAVQRPFKNVDGVHDIDIITCIIGNNSIDYCEKGDTVGIKGRLQNSNNKIEVIAEKVTYFSTKQG